MRAFKLIFLFVVVMAVHAFAAEPLIGTWTLSTQTIDGKQVDHDPLTLRIYPAGDGVEFAFSTPVNGIHLVSLKFASVHIDGKEGIVQNVQGKQIGTIKITKTGTLEYREVIEGPNRPKASGKMTISADNKTLTSESATEGSNTSRAVQVFLRQ